MDKAKKFPATLQEAVIHFADFENCKAFMVRLRWPDGKVLCPHCGSDDVAYLPNAKVFKCYEKHARQKFSLKVGTIFEDSPIALEKWLPVMWMLVNAKNGISSWEVHRSIGVTQKSAWFMLQRCRLALQDEGHGGKLGGEVEVDETYIGGKARNMHKDRKARMLDGKGGGPGGKAIVQGMLQRGGKVRASVIDNRDIGMAFNVADHVELGSTVFTDEANAYQTLQAWYDHEVINHAEAYVRDNVHTNGIENFWSLLKRGLGGTYVSVEPFHLFRYVDEQAFRFNNRKPMDDADRFQYAMRKIVGKRLTYAELTGKTGEERPTEEPF
ncbi:MAG TPA: IS1595 family transposase [Bryobacteraceae bacterium]|nr:IS1595 family transposase [Bryobacteraceae bacterium]